MTDRSTRSAMIAGLALAILSTGCLSRGTVPGGEYWLAETTTSVAPSSHLQAVLAFRESRIVKEKSCLSCHSIGDRGGTVGPILDQLFNRRSEEWLREWLKDPNAVKPGTMMPNFEFSGSEIEELLSYLVKLRKEIPTDEILSSEAGLAAKGERLLEAYDCQACHRLGDEGRFSGVDLTWIGLRKGEAWERRWLKDPDDWKPGTFMPNFQLNDDETEALAAYLKTLNGQHNDASRQWEARALFFMGGSAEVAGELVYNRFGCWGCHGVKGKNADRNPNAAPDEKVPELWGVKNRRTETEIRRIVRNGASPSPLDASRPAPPFSCPAWEDRISDRELDHLIAFVKTLAPKERIWKFQ